MLHENLFRLFQLHHNGKMRINRDGNVNVL